MVDADWKIFYHMTTAYPVRPPNVKTNVLQIKYNILNSSIHFAVIEACLEGVNPLEISHIHLFMLFLV